MPRRLRLCRVPKYCERAIQYGPGIIPWPPPAAVPTLPPSFRDCYTRQLGQQVKRGRRGRDWVCEKGGMRAVISADNGNRGHSLAIDHRQPSSSSGSPSAPNHIVAYHIISHPKWCWLFPSRRQTNDTNRLETINNNNRCLVGYISRS